MSNWIIGDLKVRGSKDNMRKFLLEGLVVDPSIKTKDKSSIRLISDTSLGLIIESKYKNFFIKGIDKGFIDASVIEAYMNDWNDNEENILILGNYKSLLNINSKLLADVSKEFDIDFKILGFNRVKEINQDVEIIKGKVIKDEIIEFSNYKWDCIRPNIGGN